jgi:hypothetical protein
MRFRKMREVLAADPESHDGEVIHHDTKVVATRQLVLSTSWGGRSPSATGCLRLLRRVRDLRRVCQLQLPARRRHR